MRGADWIKLAVTYLVPYCVATYGAARYAVNHAKDKSGNQGEGSNRRDGG
jgi:hypothetical protein